MVKKEFAQLAHTYAGQESIIGWYMSRKLNGWGCIWDGGITRGLSAERVPWYYKGGDDRLKEPVKATGLWTIGRADKFGIRPKVLHAPDWFLDCLPAGLPLHGEMWLHDDLSKVKSVCGCSTTERRNDPRWHEVRFVVYNMKPYSLWDGIKDVTLISPNGPPRAWYNGTWTSRMDLVSTCLEENWCFRKVGSILEQDRIDSLDAFHEYVAFARRQGWEGIVILNPMAPYECARSHNLLKVKPEFDLEAKIVGWEDGKTGKNIGKVGAIIVRLTWDEKVLSITGGKTEFIGKTVEFKVSGLDDNEREWDYVSEYYPLGSQLHFTFLCVSSHGVPCSCNRIKCVEED